MHSNDDDASEYVITGSVDDTVKVWEYKNKSLKLKHKLTGHSLGVVSVAVNSDGSSEKFFLLMKHIYFYYLFFQFLKYNFKYF